MENKIIVAVDKVNHETLDNFIYPLVEKGVSIFKLGHATYFDRDTWHILFNLSTNAKCKIFIDLKLYDTKDTVEKTIKSAAYSGISFITVHNDVQHFAMNAKPEKTNLNILNICHLTDHEYDENCKANILHTVTDGVVIPAYKEYLNLASYERHLICVCPGIRLPENQTNNHRYRVSPGEAINRGADYIVIGRPLYESKNPIKVLEKIVDDMKEKNKKDRIKQLNGKEEE